MTKLWTKKVKGRSFEIIERKTFIWPLNFDGGISKTATLKNIFKKKLFLQHLHRRLIKVLNYSEMNFKLRSERNVISVSYFPAGKLSWKCFFLIILHRSSGNVHVLFSPKTDVVIVNLLYYVIICFAHVSDANNTWKIVLYAIFYLQMLQNIEKVKIWLWSFFFSFGSPLISFLSHPIFNLVPSFFVILFWIYLHIVAASSVDVNNSF